VANDAAQALSSHCDALAGKKNDSPLKVNCIRPFMLPVPGGVGVDVATVMLSV